MLGSVIGVNRADTVYAVQEMREAIVTVETKVALDDGGLLTLEIPRSQAPHVGDEITVTVEYENGGR